MHNKNRNVYEKIYVSGAFCFHVDFKWRGKEKFKAERKEMKKCHALAAVKRSYVLSCVIQ